MHTLTRLILAAGLDPNTPTTARQNIGTIAGSRPGEAIGEAGRRATEQARTALWPWFLFGLMVMGAVIMWRRQNRLQAIGAALAGSVLLVVFAFQTEALGELLKGLTGSIFGG